MPWIALALGIALLAASTAPDDVPVDHSARAGAGAAGVQTLHRIEESQVRAEVEAAGFTLAEQADFLRNPDDARDWNASPRSAAEAGRRGASDRFVYRFVRPAR